MNQKRILVLEWGDPSGDGYDKAMTATYEVNFPKAEVEKAYKKAVKQLKVNPVERWCNEYEDDWVDADKAEKLLTALGFNLEEVDKSYHGDGYDVSEIWPEIYLRMVKFALPEFEYGEVYFDTIEIGGYGLVSA